MKRGLISIGVMRVIFAFVFLALGLFIGKKWLYLGKEEKKAVQVDIMNASENKKYIFHESFNNNGQIRNSIDWDMGRFVLLPVDLDERLFEFRDVPSGLKARVSRSGSYSINLRLDGQSLSLDKDTAFTAQYLGDSPFKDQNRLAKEFRINFGHWEKMFVIGARDGINLSNPFSIYSYKQALYIVPTFGKDVMVVNVDGIQSHVFSKILSSNEKSFKGIAGDGKGNFVLFSCDNSIEVRDIEFNVQQTLPGKCQYGEYDNKDNAYYTLSYAEKKLYRLNVAQGYKSEYLMDTDASKIVSSDNHFFLGKGFQLKIYDKKNKDLIQVIDFNSDIQSLAFGRSRNVIFVALTNEVYVFGYNSEKNAYRIIDVFDTDIDSTLDMYSDFDTENLYLIDGERNQVAVYRYIGH